MRLILFIGKMTFSDLLRIIIAPESDVDGRLKRLFIWATSLRVLRLPLTSNLNSKIKELISSNCFLLCIRMYEKANPPLRSNKKSHSRAENL